MFLILLMGSSVLIEAYGMDAPGSGGRDWHYSQTDYHWYYQDSDKENHTGWLQYEGEWYWFDANGRMMDGGYRDIDGVRYFFFSNGHMAWNQYHGLQYLDDNGQEDDEHKIRVVGSESPDSEDRNLLTDYLYEVPRSWIKRFTDSGWELMFYKKKNYFSAPGGNGDIYYVYHDLDTHYKKAKFTDVDSVLQVFGEYVGYASGCYRKNSEWMDTLWNDFQALRNILEIPGYYSDDKQFYFGKIFAGYLDDQTREEMMRAAPETCEVLEEILHSEADEETRVRLKAKREAERKEAEEKAQRAAQSEGYGPGVKRPENSGTFYDDHSASSSQRS